MITEHSRYRKLVTETTETQRKNLINKHYWPKNSEQQWQARRDTHRYRPSSTGDRMYMIHTAEIEFEPNTGGNSVGYEWKIGRRYIIDGFTGSTVHVHGVYDRNNGTGILAVHYNTEAKYDNYVPSVGSVIRDPDDNTIKGQVKEVYDVYITAQNIMGYDNFEHGLDVDNFGSANVRFAEGQPQLDAWGKLRTAGATMLGNYVFGGEAKLTDNFSQVEIDTGYVNYDNTRKSVKVGFETSGVTAQTFAVTHRTLITHTSQVLHTCGKAHSC